MGFRIFSHSTTSCKRCYTHYPLGVSQHESKVVDVATKQEWEFTQFLALVEWIRLLLRTKGYCSYNNNCVLVAFLLVTGLVQSQRLSRNSYLTVEYQIQSYSVVVIRLISGNQ